MEDKFEVREVPIDEIVIPEERVSAYLDEGEAEALKTSIQRFGIFAEPICLLKDGKYILIAGKNRIEKAKELGYKTIRVKLWKGSESDAILMHLAENMAKGRIDALELYKYIVKIQQEQGLSIQEIAKIVGCSESKLYQAIRIANLEDEIKEALMQDIITEAHANLLAQIKDKEQRMDVFEKIVTHELSVEDARKYWYHGWLRRCDICGKEGQELQVLFRGTPSERWVCQECLAKHYPNIKKLMDSVQEKVRKAMEEGSYPDDFRFEVKCWLCGMKKAAHKCMPQNICKDCFVKLMKFVDQVHMLLGKKIWELTDEDIQRLVVRFL